MTKTTLKQEKRTVLLVCSILLAVLLTALCVTGRITRKVESKSGTAYEQKVDSVAFGFKLEQKFMPQYEKLDAVRVHIDAAGCAKDVGALQVRILDEKGEEVFMTELPIADLPQYGWVEVPVQIQMTPGRPGTLILESVGCVDNGPKISFLDARLAAATEQQGFSLVYAGMDVEHSALQAAFVYAVPIECYEYLAYYMFGLFLMFLVIL